MSSTSESEEEPFQSSGSEYVPSDHDKPGPSGLGKLFIRNKKTYTVKKVQGKPIVKQNVDQVTPNVVQVTANVEKKGKKRIRSPEKWQRNILKSKKAKGETFLTKSGRQVPARSIGRECTCRKKCFSSVGDAKIRQILQEFNAIGDRNKQDTYLCGLISTQPVARKRKRIGSVKDRHASFKYKVS